MTHEDIPNPRKTVYLTPSEAHHQTSAALNILAHLHLSFQVPSVMAGNFLADHMRGQNVEGIPAGVLLGVEIHKFIDNYTDTDPFVLDTRKLLYPYFSKYAGVVQDVFFDHFLALDWANYSRENLSDFAAGAYRDLENFTAWYSPRAQRTLHYMRIGNWLEGYATEEGIGKALAGLSRRARFPSNMENALPALRTHRQAMKAHFDDFYPRLIRAVNTGFEAKVRTLE